MSHLAVGLVQVEWQLMYTAVETAEVLLHSSTGFECRHLEDAVCLDMCFIKVAVPATQSTLCKVSQSQVALNPPFHVVWSFSPAYIDTLPVPSVNGTVNRIYQTHDQTHDNAGY